MRNQDVSNYPFAEDVKNHVCLVSPAQSKKNPKVSAKTVVVPEHARPINRRDKILFCPGHNWDKKFLSPSKWDKTVLSPGQIFVPGTELFKAVAARRQWKRSGGGSKAVVKGKHGDDGGGAAAMVARCIEHNDAFGAALADPTACLRTLRICSAAVKI